MVGVGVFLVKVKEVCVRGKEGQEGLLPYLLLWSLCLQTASMGVTGLYESHVD